MLFIVGLIVSVSLAYGTIWEVSPSESIQTAANQGAPNDTILLHDGIYVETVILSQHPLVICSNFLFDQDSTHIASTILQADIELLDDTMSCIVVRDLFEGLTQIIGLTLERGQGTYLQIGGDRAGGAIYVWKSKVRMRNCMIRDSRSTFGGGVFAYGFPDWDPIGSLQVNACLFEDCYSTAWGGGLYAIQCSLTVRECAFQNDTAATEGGGILASDCKVTIGDTRIENCIAEGGGTGGINIGGGQSHIFDCFFEGNATSSTLQWAAHLALADGMHVVEGCHFGATSSFSKAINFCCDEDATHIFRGNVVENNVATAPFGIGNVYLGGSAGEFSYNIIRNNETRYAQLYAFQGATMEIHHNVIENNVSTFPQRASVYRVSSDAQTTFHDNLITGNSGNTIDYVPLDTTLIDVRNNWWGDASGPYHPTQNPGGQGDTILSDSVLFIPWLTEPPDTTMPSSVGKRPLIPSTWELVDVYPNPFNSSIRIVIAGFAHDDFQITLHNLLGQEIGTIHNGAITGGEIGYTAPANLASGVYFLRLSDKQQVQSKKIVFLK